ncbi:glycosyltransferase family 4 protein [Williamsia herbipolensis]|uniref:Glycosyltransferase family 4 protein n=1 Tax=Williamsia herbipolensis TaxID=1603258 RepID=A0AAU4K7L5_9NOCA|nr:glycosyltransferase family 4 protein [Williamsia herbipolensis]
MTDSNESAVSDNSESAVSDGVLFVTHSPQRSGAESVMLDLATECHRRGMSVSVACPVGPLSQSFPPWVVHVEIPHLGRDHGRRTRAGAAWGMARSMVIAARTLRAHRGTPIVANSAHTLPALRLAGVRSVAWLVHDHVVSTKTRMFIAAGRPLLDRVVAVSPTTASALDGLVDHVAVGRLGVDIPDTAPTGTPTTGALRAGTLSVLTPWKGIDVFLEAVARIEDATAVVAGEAFPGDVGYAAQLRERAGQPDLAGCVTFPGRVRAADALAEWTVHVSASIAPEAGPLTAMEAMAAGVPVVATDHGNPSTLLADRRGVLVPPGDPVALAEAMSSIAADPVGTAAMVRRAYAHVAEHHDRRETVPALLDLLVGTTRSSAPDAHADAVATPSRGGGGAR